MFVCIALFLPFLNTAAASAQAPVPSPDRLTTARDATNLVDPALKPWHLTANLDLPSPTGAAPEHATFEEWWASPTRWKTVYTSPSSTLTSIQDGDTHTHSHTGTPRPEAAVLLIQHFASPVAAYDDTKRLQPVEQQEKFGSVDLSCAMLETSRKPDLPAAPLFLYPTLCFDSESHLRLLSLGGQAIITRNKLGVFQGKSVAMDLSISEGKTSLATMSVAQLATFDPSPSDFVLQPSAEPTSSTEESAARVSSGVAAGYRLGGNQPAYPAYAKHNHISGAVVLRGIIGDDGHILTLSPVSWPGPSLADSALLAVRTWTYKPYVLNGSPSAIETTLTINFNFAP